MKVVYFGTPVFAASVLHYLLSKNVNIVAVVTKPDRPQGRSGTPVPTPVKSAALEWNPNIPVYQPAMVSAPEITPILEKYQADLFVVVAYGEIIKQHLLDMPKKACINLHASLLPKYRGAAPIQRCIINGETETGITIMHMVKKMDAGDMIETVKVPIGPNMTYGELESALCAKGSELLFKTILEFENGIPPRMPQNHDLATLAPKIELEDCQIDWHKSAQELHNLVRGVNPHPGAWCWVEAKQQRKRLRLTTTRVITDRSGTPGQILNSSKEGMLVACGQGALLLAHVQMEGKKAMAAEELARGYPAGTLTFLA